MLEFLAKYHTGIEPVTNLWGESTIKLLLVHFLPKIFILFTIVTLIHSEILLDLFNRKENEKETIEKAYIRFIKGQYQIDIEGSINVKNIASNSKFK